jgi:uncharacterized membrane protein (DUF106 family)
MHRSSVLLAACALLAAGHAFADDTVTAAGKAQQRKVMQECMKKQKAASTEMSKADIERICQEQMQAQKDENAQSSGAPQTR